MKSPSPQTPLTSGEGLQRIGFPLLLHRPLGEGGREGEGCRTDVNREVEKPSF